MYKVLTGVFLFALLTIVGCTENGAARSFGGTMTVDVPCGQKVFDVTWKDADFWYATRPMHEGEKAEKITFVEKSVYGMLQGKVVLIEYECE